MIRDKTGDDVPFAREILSLASRSDKVARWTENFHRQSFGIVGAALGQRALMRMS